MDDVIPTLSATRDWATPSTYPRVVSAHFRVGKSKGYSDEGQLVVHSTMRHNDVQRYEQDKYSHVPTLEIAERTLGDDWSATILTSSPSNLQQRLGLGGVAR